MKLARALLVVHAASVAFALLGLTVAIPYPHLWSDTPYGGQIYQFGIDYGGSVHIVLGTFAMLAFGVAALGWSKTAIFFAISTTLSLGMELLGTGTGWPFGAYEYTAGLGYKVLDHVPYSIPLSWFYLGFSSYLIAQAIVDRIRPDAPAWIPVLGTAWLLTAWDLALDPAMAHPDLPLRFWVWHETGPYLGMPLINFAGWAMTGALFTGLSRIAWREPVDTSRLSLGFPLAVYQLNMLFAIVLSASVGLWLPIVLALAAGVVPACLVWRQRPVVGGPTPATT